jgi:hypothetical protein
MKPHLRRLRYSSGPVDRLVRLIPVPKGPLIFPNSGGPFVGRSLRKPEQLSSNHIESPERSIILARVISEPELARCSFTTPAGLFAASALLPPPSDPVKNWRILLCRPKIRKERPSRPCIVQKTEKCPPHSFVLPLQPVDDPHVGGLAHLIGTAQPLQRELGSPPGSSRQVSTSVMYAAAGQRSKNALAVRRAWSRGCVKVSRA